MTVNPSSLWKVMDLVGKLSNKKVKVTFMGEVKVYTPLPLIIKKGFSSIGIECQKCGKCCSRIRHDLFWLKKPEGIKVEEVNLKLNTKNKTIYVHRNGGDLCSFFKKKLCTIQRVKPLHCLMPPIYVDEWEGRYYLKKRFYRSFPCKARQGKPNIQEDINKFTRLKEEVKSIGLTLREVKL